MTLLAFHGIDAPFSKRRPFTCSVSSPPGAICQPSARSVPGPPPPSPLFFISVHGSVDILGTTLVREVDKARVRVFSDEAGGTMAEVGLLPIARVALQVATQVLPPYRTRFSKHQFTQPQLLAVLCLMRYEDWTFREAETRLREHQELRAALKLREVPDYTTLYRFLRRLDDVTVERGLGQTGRRPRRRPRRAVSVAIHAPGLSYNSVSTFFILRLQQHADRSARHRQWL